MDTTYLDRLLDDALGDVGHWLSEETVREVMVNAPDDVWVERAGALEPVPASFSARAARTVVYTLLALARRSRNDVGDPVLVDTAWRDWRLSAVLPPIAVRGPALCFRRHGSVVFPLPRFLGIREPIAGEPLADSSASRFVRILSDWIAHAKNLLISGSTGSGKTALLNSLIALIPASQRVVVIEDTRELQVQTPNHVIFEANPACRVSLRDLVRQSLRFRPDRLIVGEVRGAEAFDLLQAMNTGHQGCLGTLHANSATDAVHRLAQLVLQAGMGWTEEAIAGQIGRSIHGIVHLQRTEGIRRIDHLQQLEGYDHGTYRWAT